MPPTTATAAPERQAVAARPGQPRVEWILTALTLASILLAWYAIAHYRLVSDLFVPHPAAVWEAFVDVLTEGYRGETLTRHLADSLYRVVAGFALAVVTAVPLGLAIGYSPRIAAIQPAEEDVLLCSSVPRVSQVDFQINVGTTVPRSVRVVPLPATIVEVQPAWRGFMYFVVGERIVIVEPDTLRIVAVIDA